MTKTKPNIRFQGFEDDWEQRKLGEISKSYSGGTPSASNSEYYGGKIPFIRSAEINSNATGLFLTQSGLKNSSAKKVKIGDILYALYGATSGEVGVSRINGVINQAILAIQPNFNFDSLFIMQWLRFKKQKITDKYLQGGQGNLSGSIVKNLVISLPMYEEQQKIGQLFKQLDKTIALHQRQLELLKEQKKGFLQKMFPKAGETVPEIRFAGFADDWENRKLSDLTERVTRKNKNNESRRPLTISAQEGLIDQNEFFDKQIASRDVRSYFLVKNGEFAYNKSYSNGYPWGAVKRLDNYEMGVLSTLYIVFRPTNVSSQFLSSYYDTTRWYKEVAKNAAEGARNHGLLNIAPTDFFNTTLVIPKLTEEQKKIGTFFKQLDKAIVLHQCKLDALKEMKKGFLQQMFV